jgi:DNA-binding transcriptional ArsR family regulator
MLATTSPTAKPAEPTDIAVVMRTLADPTRRTVFERIVATGEATVTELTRGSNVSQPAVSQHLRALRDAGLVAERREGRNVHYSPQPHGLAPLVDWLGIYGVFWRERFANLKVLLQEIDHDRRDNTTARHRRRRAAAARR